MAFYLIFEKLGDLSDQSKKQIRRILSPFVDEMKDQISPNYNPMVALSDAQLNPQSWLDVWYGLLGFKDGVIYVTTPQSLIF